ncbi:hypothetical protein O3S80_47920 [Streptomyces sp. Lzd4kr]|nr:hypothetical protein [Streptomyces sp. Lzd4kr]
MRSDTVSEHRHLLRRAAYAAASQARRLAAQLDAESSASSWDQRAWSAADRQPTTAARYTRAALAVLDEALMVVTAAVATDRAVGDDWTAIGAALGVSADTASRRYRPHPNRP